MRRALLLLLLTGCPQHPPPPAPVEAPTVVAPPVEAPVAAPAKVALPRGTTRVVLQLQGAGALQTGDRIDLLSLTHDRATHEPRTALLLQDVLVTGAGAVVTGAPRDVSLAMLPEQARGAAQDSIDGTLYAAARGPGDDGLDDEPSIFTRGLLLSERSNSLLVKHSILVARASDGGAFTSPPRRFRSFAFRFAHADLVAAGDHIDLTAIFPNATGTPTSRSMLQNLEVLATGESDAGQREFTLLVLADEALELLLMAELGTLKLTLRHPEDQDVLDLYDDPGVTPEVVRAGEREKILLRKRSPSCGHYKYIRPEP